ncbi:MAG: hypothetical protein NUV91_00090 [Candidatus Omnitrophica bacterium]|nr:hypothetical protein [Candidatus Omnitrophota bacterium]
MGLATVLFPLEDTLWIYIPIQEKIMDFKSQKKQPPGEVKAIEQPNINFLKCEPKNGTFEVKYDIASGRKYPQDTGYSVSFSEKYQSVQRGVLNALGRAYSEVEYLEDSKQYVEKVPGDVEQPTVEGDLSHERLVHAHIKTSKVPEFFVIVIADIVTGIETQTFLRFEDFKRVNIDPYFAIEYVKRMISDYPQGDPKIIGDHRGTHLQVRDITWPEFIAKQIEYRVRLNYQYAETEKAPTPPQEQIIKTIVETFDAYDFTDYQAVELNDLEKNAIQQLRKEDLTNPSMEESGPSAPAP